MTCRDIERLILEKGDLPWKAEERPAVEAHLHKCAECRKFEAGLLGIRGELEGLDWNPLPESLSLRTKRMALDVLREKTSKNSSVRGRMSVPGPILASLAVLTILTGVWITLSLAGIDPGETLKDLPLSARLALLLIAQNALILFFTPIILRAIRPVSNGTHSFQ